MGMPTITGPAWRRWAAGWSPVVVLGGIWTALTVEPVGIVAALLVFGVFGLVAVGVVRDSGREASWGAVPVASPWLTACLGPLFDAAEPTLMVLALMLLTAPGLRALWRGSRTELPVELLSDWDLETQWSDTEAELRRRAAPEVLLDVVRRRAALLDELVRRRAPRT